MSIPQYIFERSLSVHPVGSRVTCDPPPLNTDADFLVLLPPDAGDVISRLIQDDWRLDGSFIEDKNNDTDESARFNSYTRGDINLIVTKSSIFHDRFIAASSIAKRLNLLNKADRIAVFQAVLYGNACDDAS